VAVVGKTRGSRGLKGCEEEFERNEEEKDAERS
jgi:hypothetical protein